jgi:hypothetical protein
MNDVKTQKSSNVATILWLIFFFPVGLYFLWKKTNWNKKVKWGITIILVLLLFNSGYNYSSASKVASLSDTKHDQTSNATATIDPHQKELNDNIAQLRKKIASNVADLRNGITDKPTSKPQSTPIPSIITIDAAALVSAYDKNKIAAQEKYTGKIIQTSAYIQNISKDILGKYFITTKAISDTFGTSIDCFFKDKNQVLSLEKGQQATFKGTMQDMSLGSVYMDNCEIIK